MNNQVIVPIAVIVLIGLVMLIIFLDRKDKKEVEKQLNEDYPRKRSSDTDDGEKQRI